MFHSRPEARPPIEAAKFLCSVKIQFGLNELCNICISFTRLTLICSRLCQNWAAIFIFLGKVPQSGSEWSQIVELRQLVPFFELGHFAICLYDRENCRNNKKESGEWGEKSVRLGERGAEL